MSKRKPNRTATRKTMTVLPGRDPALVPERWLDDHRTLPLPRPPEVYARLIDEFAPRLSQAQLRDQMLGEVRSASTELDQEREAHLAWCTVRMSLQADLYDLRRRTESLG